jgi:hypothetical protein
MCFFLIYVLILYTCYRPFLSFFFSVCFLRLNIFSEIVVLPKLTITIIVIHVSCVVVFVVGLFLEKGGWWYANNKYYTLLSVVSFLVLLQPICNGLYFLVYDFLWICFNFCIIFVYLLQTLSIIFLFSMLSEIEHFF